MTVAVAMIATGETVVHALLAAGETKEARDWLESLAERSSGAAGRAGSPSRRP